MHHEDRIWWGSNTAFGANHDGHTLFVVSTMESSSLLPIRRNARLLFRRDIL
jgi:hypothetical protein